MPPLPLLVFVVGTGSLGAEIAAVRLLAPYFGASTIVWANTIGIVLVALSIGYWLGGRLADRNPHMRGLCLLALAAAGLLALVPFVADPMLDIAVQALDEISAGAFLGSLFGVLVLVAVPVLLLGAVSPYAIRLAVSTRGGSRHGRRAPLRALDGGLAGRHAALRASAHTAGGHPAHLPRLRPGHRGHGCVGAAPGAPLRARPRGDRRADRAPGWDTQGRGRIGPGDLRDGDRVPVRAGDRARRRRALARAQRGPGAALRSTTGSTVLTGDVWDGHLVLGFAGLDRPPRRVAILGNAAGTTARAYEEFFPDTRVDGVEIDPELSDIGREFFDMNNPRLHLYHEDARPYLRRTEARYDQISVDAYRQPYIPFYLTTVEFFETVRDRLRPGGVLIVNAGHPEGQDDLEKVLTATIGEVFPHILRDPIEDTNTLIVASESSLSADGVRDAVPGLPAGLRSTARLAAGRLEAPLRGGEVYTDDKAPVEWLIDKSIVDYAAEGERPPRRPPRPTS